MSAILIAGSSGFIGSLTGGESVSEILDEIVSGIGDAVADGLI